MATKSTHHWPSHKQQPVVDMEAGTCYGDSVENADAHVRRGFLRKVFGLVSFQLALTAAMSAMGMFIPALRHFLLNSPSMLILTFFSSIGFIVACHVYKNNHPTNLWALVGFTVSMGWSVATVCAQYYERGLGILVLEAVALTASVTVGLTAYTLRSKSDFSFLGAGLGAALWVLILGGFVAAFTAAPAMHLAFAVAGAAIFSLYIVYDVFLISRRLSPDEYVVAAISLYLDIVNLFLHILRILSELQRD